jgi:hypothetical protein
MFIRIIARVLETNEDLLLQDIEPADISFVWSVKYARVLEISNFYSLEKGKKTVVVYEDGTIDVIREDVDKFAVRLEEVRIKLDDDREKEIEIEGEEVELDDEEEED